MDMAGGGTRQEGAARRGSPHRDERGVVTAHLVRLIVVFALLIVCVEETGQIVLAQIRASNAAGTAAQAGADDYYVTKNSNHAEIAAQAALAAADPHASMESFSIERDGTVTVTVSEPANTLFVQRISFLKHLTLQHATESEIHTLA